ncbi:hypothetical protein LR48_Vigan01g302800 [Vigna angularis]|uniref:Uncharacterized protein n=1 Tax=Phaseolus angularis TaxID=3914 RepID=A0A0L9TSU7_PHAAN|nr:hypothetical protein LR48_Vigan01g302800 [Vigna angularis]
MIRAMAFEQLRDFDFLCDWVSACLAKQLRDAKKKARFREACISGLREVAAKLARKEIESRLVVEDEGIAILVADTIHVCAMVDSGYLKVDGGGFKVADG